jgi:hypothetical protein
MTLFANRRGNDKPERPARRRSSSLRAKTNQAKRDAAAAAAPAPPPPGPPGPITLSPSAQAAYDEIASQWDLTPPVRVLLRLFAEALTKAEHAEAVTMAEGMTLGDQKGSRKPHPCALLARDYRAQAATTMQRILSALGD